MPEVTETGELANLADLAETLENMGRSLAEILPTASNEKAARTLERCVAGIESVTNALHSLAYLYNPAAARQFGKDTEDFSALAVKLSERVGELAKVNQQVGARLEEQADRLGRLVDLRPGEDIEAHLQSSVTSVRQVAGQIRQNLQAISEEVETAHRGITELDRELRETRKKVAFDSLTRLQSRAALDEFLDRAVRQGDAAGPWCVLLLDVDDLKRVNDTHGHLVGDALLYNVARVLERSARWKTDTDFLARYGGDEFVVVVAHTGIEEAAAVAERLRASVASTRWQHLGGRGETIIAATVSIGVTQYRSGDTVADLLGRADRALYQAKGAGRDQIALG